MKMVGLFNLTDIAFAKFSSLIGGKKYSTITEDGEKDYWKNRENRWRFCFQISMMTQFTLFLISGWYFKSTNNYVPMIYNAFIFGSLCVFWFISLRVLMKFEERELQDKTSEMKNIHIILMFGSPLIVLCAYLIQMIVS